MTFLVGDNGTGKSTLIEAIAVAAGFNPEGGSVNFRFSTRAAEWPLGEYLRSVRGIGKPRTGFFLRAESFYNVATEIDRLGVGNNYGGAMEREADQRADRVGGGSDGVLISVTGVELQDTWETDKGWSVNGTASITITTALIGQTPTSVGLI
ncbi:AAA family ATPase [Micromonospora sp. NPDC049301]|uniref:AAA family ATPase n=1 Tax=Micromonospora sp. NPDC049301 TaxID=3155723 RepID=UPI00342146A3